MFGFFKRKPQRKLSFEFLETYPNKDKYFVRTLQWDWLNEKMIHIFDNKSPRVITMNEWPQQIFLDADGQKTIAEYVVWMANQFEPEILPATLDEDMIKMIEDLIEDGGIIELKEKMTELPYYINNPKSKQDLDKAYDLMVKDGYIKSGNVE